MICPRCGRTIEDEMLYCGYCGEEIRIVPDFIPEVEISIEETLNSVVKELTEEENDDSVSDLDNSFSKKPLLSKLNLVYFFLVGIFASILLIALGIMIYHDNSATYQIRLGDRQFDKHNYRQASGYYEKAVDLKPSEFEYRNRLANCYIAMEDRDMAAACYQGLLEYDSESTLIYTKIVQLYEEVQDYDKINDFILTYGDEKIKEAFAEYIAPPPEFDHDAGEYDSAVMLAIKDSTVGNIYYTEDGTTPDANSTLYREPLYLKKGKHFIKAVFVNSFGVMSNVASTEVDVDAMNANEPIVLLESGEYTSPQLIRVVVAEDCNIYYTFDGTVPDETSRIYCDPIPLPEGTSSYQFVSINSKGEKSEVVTRDYSLNVSYVYDKDEGVYRLVDKLVEVGYLLDFNGNLKDYPGYFTYVYSEMRSIGGLSLYCFNEYYNYASISRNMTSNSFGVDMNTGEVYVITKTENNVFSVKKL